MSSLPTLLTAEDVAEYLHVDVVTVRRLVNRGELTAYKIGNEYRFSEQHILQYLESKIISGRQAPGPVAQMLKDHAIDIQPFHLAEPTRAVLRKAMEDAQHRKIAIDVPQILVALSREVNSPTAKLLSSAGLTAEKLTQLAAQMERGVEDMTVSEEAVGALQSASAEAARMGFRRLRPTHLLLGILLQNGESAQVVFREAGIQPDSLRADALALMAEHRRIPRRDNGRHTQPNHSGRRRARFSR